jgi:hypothetical protein
MREIRTSGSMSGDGKRDDVRVATAPILDSTENKGSYALNAGILLKIQVVSSCGLANSALLPKTRGLIMVIFG